MPLIQGDPNPVSAALLAVATDLPALRKVTQFLGHKADLGCHMCKTKAIREANTKGASGRMSYYTPHPCEQRRDDEVRQQASEFKDACSKSEARSIAQKNGVRYSELIRLPYLDTVRMNCLDPMHTFLLGMVKRETQLNLAMLSSADKSEFQRRMKCLKLPYNIGRLPSNIFDDDSSLGNITAQQWKNYAIVCARPCMYKLLPDVAYKSLVLLCQIVELISSPIFTVDNIATLHRHLNDHHNIFNKVYGKWTVTVNYHLALHIPDIIMNMGPPQSFWCFPYERMNGILSKTPNSNRSIEVEVMNRHLRDYTFCSIPVQSEGIPTVLKGLISEDSESHMTSAFHVHWVKCILSTVPDRRFMRQQTIDKGDVVDWPVVMLHPSKKSAKVAPQFHHELKSFFQDMYGNEFTYVPQRVNKYGRCTVNGQTFSSDFNSTDRGSIVKTMFVNHSNELEPYFGIVRYFFTVVAIVDQKAKHHELAYVTWLKFKAPNKEPLSKLFTVTKDYYSSDRIISPRRFMRRCTLLSPRVSESFYFVSELPK